MQSFVQEYFRRVHEFNTIDISSHWEKEVGFPVRLKIGVKMNIDKLVVSEESGQYLTCLCPFISHDDTVASLVINKVEHNGRKKGYYYCFGCGKSGKISEEQVDKLAQKKGYTKKARPVNWHKQAAMFTGGCLTQNYPGDFIYNGSSQDYMIGWECYSKYYTAPMYNDFKEVIGIHTRGSDGTKRSIEGSRLGLFLPSWSYPRLINSSGVYKTIIICEGLSDTLVAYYCSGLYSIGLPSATFGHTIVRDFLKNINFDGNIVVVCDVDEAGFESVNKLTEILDNQYPITVILPTPYSDLYDYYKHCGVENTRKLLSYEGM